MLVLIVLLASHAQARVRSSPPSLCDDDGDWKMVWQDEFEGSTLDPVWTIPIGVGNGFGREANVSVEDTYLQNGTLVLRSRQHAPGVWTTGAAITDPKQYGGHAGINWQYGRFCIRAKLPGAGPGKSQGLWPAHWMMPSDYKQHCGYNEMDILEMVNGDETAYGTYWYWGPGDNCTGPPVRAGYGTVKVPTYYTDFHEYAIEWTPKALTYYVDQKPYKSYTDPSMLPVNPHFMMLNSAVGGSWPGAPNDSTIFPAYHYIDYVRVSQNSKFHPHNSQNYFDILQVD